VDIVGGIRTFTDEQFGLTVTGYVAEGGGEKISPAFVRILGGRHDDGGEIAWLAEGRGVGRTLITNKKDVKERDEDLTSEPEMLKAFRDTWELGIHSYLTYVRDRLLLAKDLLSETETILGKMNSMVLV
jgi:hypothetical protein